MARMRLALLLLILAACGGPPDAPSPLVGTWRGDVFEVANCYGEAPDPQFFGVGGVVTITVDETRAVHTQRCTLSVNAAGRIPEAECGNWSVRGSLTADADGERVTFEATSDAAGQGWHCDATARAELVKGQ